MARASKTFDDIPVSTEPIYTVEIRTIYPIAGGDTVYSLSLSRLELLAILQGRQQWVIVPPKGTPHPHKEIRYLSIIQVAEIRIFGDWQGI